MNVPVEQVEPALARMWTEDAAQGSRAHLTTVNLVAVCEGPEPADRARAVLESVLPEHPGRALVVHAAAGEPPTITADVDLLRARGVAFAERVALEARGAAREWVPTAVERLLAPGARVYLWWVGDLPDDDLLFDRLIETADVVAINSEDMDLRDLATLATLSLEGKGRFALADLNWRRLRPWQELLALFFDDPAVLPALARAHTLTLACAPHRDRGGIVEPTSPQAGLYAGWFCSRVGAAASSARWREGSREVALPRGDGGTLTVRFESVARSDVAPGALVRVELATECRSRFEIARAEDPRVLGWRGECADAVVPEAVMRVGLPDEARLLGAALDAPTRDPLFEASLAAAAQLVAPLYPRGSRPSLARAPR